MDKGRDISGLALVNHLSLLVLEICARELSFFGKFLEFQKNQTKNLSISHQTVRTVAAQSAKFSFSITLLLLLLLLILPCRG